MLTVQFEDHTNEFLERMRERLVKTCVRAAEVLAEAYVTRLTINEAPPHSKKGEIPHAYFGWKVGGYGPTNDSGVNNPGQTDYLATYISYARSDNFNSIGAEVGFLPSHVDEGQNYLLRHNASSRPWINPIYAIHFHAVVAVTEAAFNEDL
jgi:hypothetical protein